jgi:dihydrofolate synthase/folylpolyglutamate synthase
MKDKSFTSSDEVFSWLSGFINLEQGQKPKSFRIDRMEALMELADHPEKCAPSIHIAGSKGKGSVTSMLAAMLTAAGFRAARYMSPHVIDIRERICLGDSFFSEDVYCSAGNELRHIAENLLPPQAAAAPQKVALQTAALFDASTDDGCAPTFWELLTLLFFLCAREAKCDVMVIETGMGGRLDSTNVLDPLVSVITLIELEHTNFLGNTITEVAGEKAGIIKTGKPVILAKQNDEALAVFRKTAQKKNSPLLYFPEIAEISDVTITPQGTTFNLREKNSASSASLREAFSEVFSIPIPGKVQAENAALAIIAIKTAFPQFSSQWGEDVIRKGLENLKIPARFENITPLSAANPGTKQPSSLPPSSLPPFIIDGAHTPESLTFCIETFCSLYGTGGVLIFGCAADKDAAAMANIIGSHFAKIIITTPGTFKISDPAKVYEAFTAVTGREKTELITDTQEAVKKTLEFAQKNNLPILGTGSFYLVSEIRKINF